MITDESPEIIHVDSSEIFGAIGEEKCQGRNHAQSSKEKLPSKRIRIYSVSVQVIINCNYILFIHEIFKQRTNMSYFILQEDGNFSFLETQDEKHLIPQSWKDNSYATIRNSQSHCDQNVHKDTIVPDSANSIKEDGNRKKNIPDATSTPKRNLNLLEHKSKYISLSSRTRKNFAGKQDIDIEESPLIETSIDYHR